MSQPSSRSPASRTSPFRVAPSRVKNMNEQELGELMNLLLRAQALRSGSPLDQIRVNTEEKAGDEGCDAWTAAPTTPDPWLGTTETCWQLKAGTAGQPGRLVGEVTKAIPAETLANGGRFVVVASQSVSGRGGDLKRKQILVQEAGEEYASHIDVLGSERLAEWCTQHPAIAAHINGLPASLWRLADWEASDEHRLRWWQTEQAQAEQLRQRTMLAAATDPLLHLHIYGPPGVGKSRYALELCRGASFREEVLYVRQADDVALPELISHLAEMAIEPVVVVVDEVASGQLRRLRDEVARHSGKVRLITIGYDPSPDPSRIMPHWIRRQPSEVMTRIVRTWHPTFPRERVSFVVEFADGYVRLAKLVAEAVAQDPQLGAGNLLTIETIRQHLQGLLGRHRHDVLYVVALLNRVGWTHDLQVEGQCISEHLGLDWREVQREVSAIDQELHIAPRGGRFRMISPRPLALYLAAEAWEANPELIEGLPEALPSTRARLAFLDRLRQMASFQATAQYAGRMLQAPFGLQDLSNDLAIRQWGTRAASQPELGLARLRMTLERASSVELERMPLAARQTLVEELRRLAWPSATFHDAVQCLALLAVSDNDRLGVKAGEIFVRLFSIRLGGTALPFEERLETIDWLLATEGVALVRLAIRAMAHAGQSVAFRVGVAAASDTAREPEWRPATDQDELAAVILALRRLREIAQAATPDLQAELLEAARNTVMGMRQEATRVAVTEFILAIRGSLPSTREALRYLVAELVEHEIHDWHELAPHELSELRALQTELEDPSLLGRTRQLIGPYHWDERRRPNLEPLAHELIQTPANLTQVLPWLMSGEANNAWSLGNRLAALDPDLSLEPVLASAENPVGDWRLLCGYISAKRTALGDAWYDGWLHRRAPTSSADLGCWLDVVWRCGLTPAGAALLEQVLRTTHLTNPLVSRLLYGNWVLDLPASVVHGPLCALIDTGHRSTALQLLSHRIEQKSEEAEFWGDLALDLILDLQPLRENEHLEYPWKALALPYVGIQAVALTRAILDSHLERHGAVWFLEFSEAKSVLIECAKHEPAAVWAELQTRLSGSEAERIVSNFPRGILEHLPADSIEHWVSEDPEPRAVFLADLTPGTYANDEALEARLVGRYGDSRRVKWAFRNALTRSWVGQASDHKEEVADRLEAVANQTALPKLRRWAQWASRTLRQDAAQELEAEHERWFGLRPEGD